MTTLQARIEGSKADDDTAANSIRRRLAAAALTAVATVPPVLGFLHDLHPTDCEIQRCRDIANPYVAHLPDAPDRHGSKGPAGSRLLWALSTSGMTVTQYLPPSSSTST